MGQRRDRLNRRLEKQAITRKANAPRKAKERARKAAYAAGLAAAADAAPATPAVEASN
ncbi:MAG: hypothetical protein HQ515_10500 [Phycisphaeraceae bacterium]|nr:hypothetical protein [Phycisphaeraceae bacterium]